MSTLWIALACLTGFLIREVMAILARDNDQPPSLTVYWSKAKNRWNVALNALCTIGIMLGRNEVISIGNSPALATDWPIYAKVGQFLQMAPILTALGIGLFSAFVIRWVTTMVTNRFGAAKKARQSQTPDPNGNDVQ